MNWNKSKNRLILLFLSINILLAWANYNKDSSAHVLKESQLQDISRVLKENNIYVDVPMPKKHKPLPKLMVFPFQMDSAIREDFVKRLLQNLDGVKVSIEAASSPDQKPRRIYRRDDESVIFEGENILYRHQGHLNRGEPLTNDQVKQGQVEKTAEKWLADLGYSPKKMHLQTSWKADHLQLIYYDKYDGIPVFDSYVKFNMTSLGVAQVEIHKVELGEATGGKQEIYSVDQIFFYLIKLIKTDEPRHIKDIMIGYALENPKGTHLIAEKALPFYQVILENGETYYVNAYNSEIREEPQL